MPVMDGEMFGRTLTADPELSSTAMVLATSAGQRGDDQRFAEAGFMGYLVKPIRPADLKRVLLFVESIIVTLVTW